MTVRIVTDSTADLPVEAVQELGINIIPAYINFEGKTYRDGVDISQDEIYHRMVDLGQIATTSQPPPADFVSLYEELLKQDEHIISLQVTSKLSGIFASAVQAKNMVDSGNRITVIDSESVSMGLGLITMAAARLAKAGESLPDILADIKSNLKLTHIWAAFDSLKYLYRGGRIGKGKALLGSVLNIKPVLTMRDGEIHPLGASRTRHKAIDKLVELANSFPNSRELAVVHSTTAEDAISLKERLVKLTQNKPVSISRLGPALGVHGGPGALVLALIEKAGNFSESTKHEVGEKWRLSLPSMPDIKLPRLRFSTI